MYFSYPNGGLKETQPREKPRTFNMQQLQGKLYIHTYIYVYIVGFRSIPILFGVVLQWPALTLQKLTNAPPPVQNRLGTKETRLVWRLRGSLVLSPGGPWGRLGLRGNFHCIGGDTEAINPSSEGSCSRVLTKGLSEPFILAEKGAKHKKTLRMPLVPYAHRTPLQQKPSRSKEAKKTKTCQEQSRPCEVCPV